MPYEGWETDGTAWTNQETAIYLKRYATLEPMAWMGNCARLDDSDQPLGDVITTRRRDPNGGITLHDVRAGIPDTATLGLVMKKLQYDRKKTDLKNCWWILDDRQMCGGLGSDYWNKWQEITRYCNGKFTSRTISATTYDEVAGDRLVTLPGGFVSVFDLYRVTGEINSTTAVVMMTDVVATQPARCPDGCDDQEDCIVVAVTETVALGTPFAVVNLNGGRAGSWAAPVALTDFGANSADQIAGAREFCVVTSSGDASIMYTYDLFATQYNFTNADMTAHAPFGVDLIDLGFVVVVGADGYVYSSHDGARNWVTDSPGGATASDLTRVMIARSNPQVIYAVSNVADVIIKSENGGRTWYAQAPTGGGTGLLSLWVDPSNHNNVLVGNDAGQLFESTDGAQTWAEQTVLDGLTATTKPNTTIADIVSCGCGVVGLITHNATDNQSLFYLNVDNGADARWYQPEEYEAVATAYGMFGLTCCGPNHWVAVGGDSAVGDLVLVLE